MATLLPHLRQPAEASFCRIPIRVLSSINPLPVCRQRPVGHHHHRDHPVSWGRWDPAMVTMRIHPVIQTNMLTLLQSTSSEMRALAGLYYTQTLGLVLGISAGLVVECFLPTKATAAALNLMFDLCELMVHKKGFRTRSAPTLGPVRKNW